MNVKSDKSEYGLSSNFPYAYKGLMVLPSSMTLLSYLKIGLHVIINNCCPTIQQLKKKFNIICCNSWKVVPCYNTFVLPVRQILKWTRMEYSIWKADTGGFLEIMDH